MTRATLLILLATLCSQPQPVPTQGERGAVIPTVRSATSGTIVEAVNAAPRVTGYASWFCLRGRSRCTTGFSASGSYAAAGPTLRAVLGHLWRGRYVTVCARHCVRVKLIDVCICAKLIDVYASVFVRLGVPLSRGIVKVSVTW